MLLEGTMDLIIIINTMIRLISRRVVTLPISAHLICISAMQLALLFVRFHEVLHKLQRHLPIFQLWTTILPLNH